MSAPNLQPDKLESLATRYERSPMARALVQLVPSFGSAVDTFLTAARAKVAEERLLTFIDEWERGKVHLSEEQIANEPFLHAMIGTVRAALNTQRREKIRLFARLLSSYYRGVIFENADEYDEALALLDDLHYREFHILTILHRYEQAVSAVADGLSAEEREQQLWRNRIEWWDDFYAAIEREVGLKRDVIPGVLARLGRTGLFVTATSLVDGNDQQLGSLTRNFEIFVRALELDEKPPG